MTESVTQRPRARADLLEQFVYFAEQESVDLAERYFAAVEETCAMLVQQPRLGVPYQPVVEVTPFGVAQNRQKGDAHRGATTRS